MAQRPIWRGNLRLALVSCPIALYGTKHERNAVRFNMINPKTGNRIRMVTVDSETGEELSRRDTVKGYEFRKDRYLLLSDDDLASVRIDSSTTLSIEKFVTGDSIDPIYYDAGYFVGPDGKDGRDVYAVLRDAIASTGRVALARVVIGQRERTVAIRATADGLIAQTLHEDRDLNSAADAYDGVASEASDPQMVALAVQLIDRQTGSYDPSDVEDRYETRLRAMIDGKLKGEGVGVEKVEEPEQTNVVDIMALLKKSLGAASPPITPASKSRRKGVKAALADDARRQPGLKLPIEGGKGRKTTEAEISSVSSPVRTVRRRA